MIFKFVKIPLKFYLVSTVFLCVFHNHYAYASKEPIIRVLISKNNNYKIKNLTNINTTEDILNILPTRVISLVHFGRSGTGLLHSLIDHHRHTAPY